MASYFHNYSPCHYCGRQATLYASGNAGHHVDPHYLCDECQRKIKTGVIQLSQWWKAPAPVSPPSQAALSWSQSLTQSSSQAQTHIQLPNTTPSTFRMSPSGSLSYPEFLPVIEKTGPVIGYRVWRVEKDRLVGFAAGDKLGSWPSGAIKAKCVNGNHREPPPSADCTCGFYAWRELANVESRSGVAVGAVQLWGKLIEHGTVETLHTVADDPEHPLPNIWGESHDEYVAEGWRAEYAKPLCLLRTPDVICTSEMAEFYKVAVAESWDSVELLAGELAQ